MRIFLFISFILLLLVGWCLGWFYVSNRVEQAIEDTKVKLAEKGESLECGDQEIGGFPFRISVFCTSLSYGNQNSGYSVTTGAVRTAAQAYQPTKVVIELDAPAQLSLPVRGNYQSNWQSLRASANIKKQGAERISVHAKSISFVPENPAKPVLEVTDLQLHSREAGNDGVDFALSINDAVTKEKLWPDFNLIGNVNFAGVYSKLLEKPDLLRIGMEQGLSGEINEFKYLPHSGGSIEVTGPFDVNPVGLLSGKFNLVITDLPKLVPAYAQLFPSEKDNVGKIAGALTAFSNSADGVLKLPITVREGQVIVGIFPVGKIPPLY